MQQKKLLNQKTSSNRDNQPFFNKDNTSSLNKENKFSPNKSNKPFINKNKKNFFNKNKKVFVFDKIRKLRKSLSYKFYKRPYFQLYSAPTKPYKHQLNITVVQNNIFCTMALVETNKIVLSCSAGKYKIKITRRKLKYSFAWVLENFQSELKKLRIRFKGLIVNITCPVIIRAKIAHLVRNMFPKKLPLIMRFSKKKCFNGCRPPKLVRKKRKGFLLLK